MRIKETLFLVIIILAAVSCSSNLTKNLVQDGSLILRNGTFNDKVWREDLVFSRNSWYHELTLQFDLQLAPVSPQSSFNFWFSKSELDLMGKCDDARVALAYTLDTKDIPYSSLYEQLEKAGYTRFDLIEFKKHLLQHPDSQLYGFKLYHVFGICKKTRDSKALAINFPGYLEKIVIPASK
ncbi:MAG: hypothetical protein Q7U04_17785 [Bacteriovorax sp.]|nr:hypothetical protein [Bacteriovorax sp.]